MLPSTRSPTCTWRHLGFRRTRRKLFRKSTACIINDNHYLIVKCVNNGHFWSIWGIERVCETYYWKTATQNKWTATQLLFCLAKNGTRKNWSKSIPVTIVHYSHSHLLMCMFLCFIKFHAEISFVVLTGLCRKYSAHLTHGLWADVLHTPEWLYGEFRDEAFCWPAREHHIKVKIMDPVYIGHVSPLNLCVMFLNTLIKGCPPSTPVTDHGSHGMWLASVCISTNPAVALPWLLVCLRYVLECPRCGVIYRERQHWYGNKDPTEEAVRTEIRHVWPGVSSPSISVCFLCSQVLFVRHRLLNYLSNIEIRYCAT